MQFIFRFYFKTVHNCTQFFNLAPLVHKGHPIKHPTLRQRFVKAAYSSLLPSTPPSPWLSDLANSGVGPSHLQCFPMSKLKERGWQRRKTHLQWGLHIAVPSHCARPLVEVWYAYFEWETEGPRLSVSLLSLWVNGVPAAEVLYVENNLKGLVGVPSSCCFFSQTTGWEWGGECTDNYPPSSPHLTHCHLHWTALHKICSTSKKKEKQQQENVL